MSIRSLSYESIRVNARILNTDYKYKKYINNFCELKDPDWVDDLFITLGGEMLDLGTIENIETFKVKDNEIWLIDTTKSWFELQILNKPEWVIVDEKKPIKLNDADRFKKRQELESILDDLESAFSKTTVNSFKAWLNE